MKTPWRFLADLTSRRRPAKAQENSTGHDAEAPESEAKPAPAVASDAAEASDADRDTLADRPAASTEAEAVRDAAEAQTPDLDDTNPSPVETDAPATTAKPQRKPPAKRQGSAKRAAADVVAKNTAAQERSAQAPSSRDPFFDEVASLDEDIRKLRSELAQKLHRQNAQLKKMLERFDRS